MLLCSDYLIYFGVEHMKNEYRNEFANSLDGSLMYLLLQIFNVAEELEKEKNVKLEHFSKEDFIKLFNSGRWTSAEDVFRVRHVLRSYGEYLNTLGEFFNFKGLSEIHKKDKHQLLAQRFVSLLLTLLFHQIETVKSINHHQGKDHILG